MSDLDEVIRALEPLEPIQKRMFGGHGIYAGDGTFFAVYMDGRLYFRIDEDTRPAYERAGSRPFSPPKGPVIRSYYEVPGDVLADESELRAWAEDAVDAARAAAR